MNAAEERDDLDDGGLEGVETQAATELFSPSSGTPDTIVGLTTGLRSVSDLIASAAPTDVPVLILGETGSGKELAAKLIHRLSRRSDGPMVRVNCGAIPQGLVDSELFGHERGSFTGATQARRGWFERAHKGTLFLDEIAELSLDAQVRLLRVLQEGVLQRVGSEREITIDVRVVAATHRDLGAMVRDGRFREDLWYRLAVFPLSIPPLRTRMGDLHDLAAHFASAAGKRLYSRPLRVSAADVAVLHTYHWPGNVRELAAVIERAAILGRGRGLGLAQALGYGSIGPSLAVSVDGGGRPPVAATAQHGDSEGVPLATLETVVRAHVVAALRSTGGQIEGPDGAAEVLGVNPHTLRARMKKLGIDWRKYRGDQP